MGKKQAANGLSHPGPTRGVSASKLRAAVRHTAFSQLARPHRGRVEFGITTRCLRLDGYHPWPASAYSFLICYP
jgi:hypothetical protein